MKDVLGEATQNLGILHREDERGDEVLIRAVAVEVAKLSRG